ncbi:metalloregulator ArsR/SmtB family transcription factor [Thalassobaculum sp.]|uniref:ArsR/SmtB family transcription factor n=1 Tax=Thalassobaculum sp. TaxID=2022740 RepID=UPI0032EC3801
MTDRIEQTKALASVPRMKVLEWLKEPRRHFIHQESGDPETIGVCVTLIAAKLDMSQPTVSRHLEILRRAGFVTVRRIGQWSYYTRSAMGISEYGDWINDNL